MDILIFGRWLILAFGAIAVIEALIITAKNPEPFKRLILIWVVGIFLVGTGAFGLEFIPKYRDWLNTLADLIKSPSKESYGAFLAKVGNEEIPPELQEAGISYAINNPVEGMEEVLTTAINNAPENTNGKKALVWAKEVYQEKQRVIDQLLKSNPSADTAKSFDPVTSKMFYERLKELPQDELQIYMINPNEIQQYKPKTRPFPRKR